MKDGMALHHAFSLHRKVWDVMGDLSLGSEQELTRRRGERRRFWLENQAVQKHVLSQPKPYCGLCMEVR